MSSPSQEESFLPPPGREDLECPACMRTFAIPSRIPHLLPCLHAVCASCLPTVWHRGRLKCPACKTIEAHSGSDATAKTEISSPDRQTSESASYLEHGPGERDNDGSVQDTAVAKDRSSGERDTDKAESSSAARDGQGGKDTTGAQPAAAQVSSAPPAAPVQASSPLPIPVLNLSPMTPSPKGTPDTPTTKEPLGARDSFGARDIPGPSRDLPSALADADKPRSPPTKSVAFLDQAGSDLTDLSGVDHVRMNFIRRSMALDENETLTCGKCGDLPLDHRISAYCVQCDLALCGSCKDAHDSSGVTSNHDVVTLKQSSSRNFRRLHMRSMCREHPGHSMDLFCTGKACRKPLCSLCAHAHESESHTLMKMQNAYTDRKRDIEALWGDLENLAIKVERAVSDLEAHRQVALNRLEQRREEALASLDSLTSEVGELRRELSECRADEWTGAVDKEIGDRRAMAAQLRHAMGYIQQVLSETSQVETLSMERLLWARGRHLRPRAESAAHVPGRYRGNEEAGQGGPLGVVPAVATVGRSLVAAGRRALGPASGSGLRPSGNLFCVMGLERIAQEVHGGVLLLTFDERHDSEAISVLCPELRFNPHILSEAGGKGDGDARQGHSLKKTTSSKPSKYTVWTLDSPLKNDNLLFWELESSFKAPKKIQGGLELFGMSLHSDNDPRSRGKDASSSTGGGASSEDNAVGRGGNDVSSGRSGSGGKEKAGKEEKSKVDDNKFDITAVLGEAAVATVSVQACAEHKAHCTMVSGRSHKVYHIHQGTEGKDKYISTRHGFLWQARQSLVTVVDIATMKSLCSVKDPALSGPLSMKFYVRNSSDMDGHTRLLSGHTLSFTPEKVKLLGDVINPKS